MRRRAKAINFGLVYGMNACGLAQRLGITPDEAQEFIDALLRAVPGVTRLPGPQVETGAAARLHRDASSGAAGTCPNCKSANRAAPRWAERMAKNTPIQGSAADILKLAMIESIGTARVVRARRHMILTVHDELVFEVVGGDGGGRRRARQESDGARDRPRGPAGRLDRVGPELVRRGAGGPLTGR